MVDEVKEITKPEDCPKWDTCSAPICPLGDNKQNYIWYPDEEICSKHKPQFVKTQKKIVKKTKDINKYFTFDMLNRDMVVTGGMVGLDPDKEEKNQLMRWLKIHPILSTQTKISRANRMKKNMQTCGEISKKSSN